MQRVVRSTLVGVLTIAGLTAAASPPKAAESPQQADNTKMFVPKTAETPLALTAPAALPTMTIAALTESPQDALVTKNDAKKTSSTNDALAGDSRKEACDKHCTTVDANLMATFMTNFTRGGCPENPCRTDIMANTTSARRRHDSTGTTASTLMNAATGSNASHTASGDEDDGVILMHRMKAANARRTPASTSAGATVT